MMKIFKTLALALCAMSAVSCFPEAPSDALHPENHFKDAAGLESWMNYCYIEFDGQRDAVLRQADDFVGTVLSDVLAGTRSKYTQTWDWSVLRQANLLLDYSHFCQDEPARERFEAEADFFRALFYFDKVRQWGDVPFYKGTVGASDAPKAANSRDYVVYQAYDLMISAAEALTQEVFEVPVRINRWVALGFAARAALFEGSYLKYGGEQGWEEYMQMAQDCCSKIMESGLFEVYSAPGWQPSNAYRNLFAMEVISPKEALLLRLYNTDDCLSEINSIYSESGLGATPRFRNHYQIINGSSITTRPGYETEGMEQTFLARDPRMAQTLWSPGCRELDSGEEIARGNGSATGYPPVKFRKSAEASAYGASFPLLRYSEILLTYAEAKAELGTLNQADLDKTVNAVRNRVGMPSVSLSDANANPDPLMASYYPNLKEKKNRGVLLEIRRERTVELALEGLRLWDMLRWHEGAQLGCPEWDEERDYLWPVPASEFDVPGCRLKQNYGY